MRTFLLLCTCLILVGCFMGCAKRWTYPDGTVEESYLDPAWESILGRVVDVASALALEPADRPDPEVEEELGRLDILLGLLDDESEALAREAIAAAEARDYAALLAALERIEALKKSRKQAT